MAPNPRVAKAFRAMRQIGIAEEIVKPVLKSLLKLYEKNWELIEQENYRALADAIFDAQDSEAAEKKKMLENPERDVDLEEEAQAHEEPERPLKRLRLRHQEAQAAPSPGNSSSTGHHQPESRIVTAFPESNFENARSEPQPVSPQSNGRNKGKQPVSPNALASREKSNSQQAGVVERTQPDVTTPGQLKDKGKAPLLPQEKRPLPTRPATGVRFKEPKQEPGVVPSPKLKAPALIKPKDEPVTDDMPRYEVPIAVIHPDSLPNGASANGHDSVTETGGAEPPTSNSCAEKDGIDEISASFEKRKTCELASVSDESNANIEIASSLSGEVKISLSCNSALGEVPDPDAVLKTLEDKYLRSYKLLDPNFSVKNLLKDMCESFLELRSDSPNQPQVAKNATPHIDLLKNGSAADTADIEDIPSCALNGSVDVQSDDSEILKFPPPCNGVDGIAEPVNQNGLDGISHPFEQNGADDSSEPVEQNSVDDIAKPVEQNGVVNIAEPGEQNGVDDIADPDEHNGVDDMAVDNNENESESEQNEDADEDEDASCQSLVAAQAEQCPPAPDLDDIAKGQERVIISLVNEVNNDRPPSFHYIPQNAVFQNAYLNFSLARIGDDNCCSTCLGDCLSSPTPCACIIQNGGEFAYTSEGLVREELIKECISMNRNPQKHCRFFCSECPIERSKNEEIIESCKGHLVRKFIKECWWKCGCSKQCGNRVVQRGINRKLQVFMTRGGKGWGLRTLEDLPKGAFVCEYVGEVLTNAELYDRVARSSNKDEHAYPVLLDADWASERDLKDEEALCLDATHFGNVARFINHRCFDSTLVEIPVEVETPDHHYYHLAFFTTRKVKALEELTWDYGIDFDDHEHPVKAFKCRCGSKCCRNIKRARRPTRFGRR